MFAADVATGLIGHLVMAISGGNLYRKSSFLLDHLGKTILPTWFNISERPHVMRGLASSPFDSEGVRTQDLEIITDGVLATYLLTSYAARKMNMTPTGHAGGIHNWYVKSTGQNYQQMLKELGTYFTGDGSDGTRCECGDGRLLTWRCWFLGRKW